MPKITQYNSQETLTTQPASTQRNIAQAGIAGENIAKFGDAAQQQAFEYADKFKKADQLRQTTAAEVKYHDEYRKLQEEIANDNESDFETLDRKAREGLDRIRGQASASIKDKEAKLAFDSQYSVYNAKAYGELRTQLRKKQIEKGTADLNNRITQLENAYSSTGNKAYLDELTKTLNEHQRTGYITPKEAQKKIKEINKGFIFSSFERDPENTLKMIDSASGPAAELNPEERSTLKGKLLKLKRSKDKELAIQKSKVSVDLVTEVLNGQKGESEINDLVKQGIVDSKFASALSEAIFNPDIWDDSIKTTSAGDYYVRSIDALENGKDEDVYSYVNQAVKDYNDKKINRNDLAFAMKAAKEKLDGKMGTLEKLKAAISIYGKKAEDIAMFAFQNGGDPRGYAAKLLKDSIKNKNPRLNTRDYIPNSISDSFGIIKKVWDSFMDEYVDNEQSKQPK